MYNPHTVSLVIVSEGQNGTTEQAVTYLEGVFLDEHQGGAVNKAGITTNDNCTLYIPLSQVKAISADTHRAQQYVPAYEYSQKQSKTNFWTVFSGGKLSSQDCFFVKGIISPTNLLDYAALRKAGASVFRVSSVTPRDYGIRINPYLEVGGQ